MMRTENSGGALYHNTRLLHYPPEANRIDEFSQCFIIGSKDIFYSAAVSSELLHRCCCHLVLRLTGQHERNQHLEAPHLCQQEKTAERPK